LSARSAPRAASCSRCSATSRTLADCRFLRAQAIVDIGGDRDEARTLARQARAVFGAYNIKIRAAEVETWLARNKL